MPRGGARPGAGRKPKATPAAACPQVTKNGVKTDPKWPFGHLEAPEVAELPAAPKRAVPARPEVGSADAELSELSPLDFMLSVMRDEKVEIGKRMQAAALAAPFVHPKMGEGGKKDQKRAAAEKVASRFAAGAPPKLVAAGGKQV